KIEVAADGSLPWEMVNVWGDPLVALSQSPAAAEIKAMRETGSLKPVALPLSATGFHPQTLARLQTKLAPLGMIPVASGGAGGAGSKNLKGEIVPGGVMGASLVTGDMDLTGLGTVTHVEGNRVWGWGHPF